MCRQITFWGVFLFCIFLYNFGFLGLSRSVFDITAAQIFFSYLIFLYILHNNNAYRRKRDFAGIIRLKGVVKGTLQFVIVYIVFAYIINYRIPRILSMTFIIIIPISAIFSRILMQFFEAKFFRNVNQENILVFGTGETGNAFVTAVSKLSSSPLKIIGFVEKRKIVNSNSLNQKPILGNIDEIESIIIKFKIDHIIVAIREIDSKENQILKNMSTKYDIALSFQPTKKLFDKNPYKLRDIAGLPLISGNQNVITEKPLYDLIKRIFDIIMSIIFLIISIPIFIVTSFLIIIFDSGPIFLDKSE